MLLKCVSMLPTLVPTGFPFFVHSTVGWGAPQIPRSMFSGSPALTRISLAPNRLSKFTLGASVEYKIIIKITFQPSVLAWRVRANFMAVIMYLFWHYYLNLF